MTDRGHDLAAQGAVAGRFCERERLEAVLLGEAVLFGVIAEPSGKLCEFGAGEAPADLVAVAAVFE